MKLNVICQCKDIDKESKDKWLEILELDEETTLPEDDEDNDIEEDI